MNGNQISDAVVRGAGFKPDATVTDEEINARINRSFEQRCLARAAQKECQKQRRFPRWFPLDRLFAWLMSPPSSR